jgi:hypothetical protein
VFSEVYASLFCELFKRSWTELNSNQSQRFSLNIHYIRECYKVTGIGENKFHVSRLNSARKVAVKVQLPAAARKFLFLRLGPTQPSIQWVPGALPWG